MITPQVGDIWFDKFNKHHLLITEQHPIVPTHFTFIILDNNLFDGAVTPFFEKYCEFVA
jgi:hypothetical protein